MLEKLKLSETLGKTLVIRMNFTLFSFEVFFIGLGLLVSVVHFKQFIFYFFMLHELYQTFTSLPFKV